MNINTLMPSEPGQIGSLAHLLLYHALKWPTPIELPEPITTALERVEQVMGSQQAPPPELSVDDFLAGKLDKWAAMHLAHSEYDRIKRTVLKTARQEALAAINTHAEPVWEQLNASLAVAWDRQLTHDLRAVDRVSVADASRLGADAMSRHVEATEARDVLHAAYSLAFAASSGGREMPSNRAEPLLIADPPEGMAGRVAIVSYHEGFNIHGEPSQGVTVFAWAALCKFTPSICRTRDQLEDRMRRYSEAVRYRGVDQLTAEELHNQSLAADIVAAGQR